MKLGIVGLGVVGTAVQKGFEHIGHEVKVYDIKLKNTKIEDVLDTEICYVTVGTPSDSNDRCDITAVRDVAQKLSALGYKGLVALKSTVEPGTTDLMSEEFSNLSFCFVPEFLRERCAYEDFVHNNNILVVGAKETSHYDLVVKSHGSLPVHKVRMKTVEAELVKYFSNTYKAMRITFANCFHRVASHFGADYGVIKDTFLFHGVVDGQYLNVNNDFGGYGGMCLPKDTKAMKQLCEIFDIDVGIFDFLDKENEKFVKKVPKGMRL
jgi:nucleotide sugar dehydrogenase|tara:strand:- start:952 stop:1749 length:798 start_codon:yes stop_codon:yes gene_type:complete